MAFFWQRLRPLPSALATLGAVFVLLAFFLPVAERFEDRPLGLTGLAWWWIPLLAAVVVLPFCFALWDSSSRFRSLAPLVVLAAGIGVLVVMAQLEAGWRLNLCAWSRCPQGVGPRLDPGAAFGTARLGALLIVIGGALLPLTSPLPKMESELRRRRVRSLIFPPS
jgi:hypothetical protein